MLKLANRILSCVFAGLILGLLATGTASANMGIPMLALLAPPLLFALIPVILIEAFVLYRMNVLSSLRRAAVLSAIANAVSFFIGIPITWALLVGLQLITGGGGYPDVPPVISILLAVTWQAPWMLPYPETMLRWMVPAAIVFLYIPFFFASVSIEAVVYRLGNRSERYGYFFAKLVRVHVISYILLLLIPVCYLIMI